MPESHGYDTYGVKIKSALKLPELTPISDDNFDVEIVFGKVPKSLKNPVSKTVLTQASPNEFLLLYENVANYYVQNGNLIIIDPYNNAEDEKIKLFLMGTVLTALLHQRQYWPIHASGIVVNGACIAFSGQSGAGKSTTASLFAKRGYHIIADDVCAVKLNDEGIPIVQAGYPQLRLWKDSLKLIEADYKKLSPVRNELNKFAYPVKEKFCDQPIPLKQIYLLGMSLDDKSEIKILKGASKFQSLIRTTHKTKMTKGQGNERLQFELASKASSFITLKSARHPYNKEKINDFIDLLEQDFEPSLPEQ